MATQTEAACLLESGRLYTRRLGLQAEHRDPVFLGVKAGAFSVYYGDAPVYHFDLEGRWQRAFADGVHYLKALDASVQAIDRVRDSRGMTLRRRTLSFAEASDLDETVRSAAIELLASFQAGRLRPLRPPAGVGALADEDVAELLGRAARWDTVAWFAQREAYADAYGALPFLPPDCLSAVVLQATLGHEGGIAFGSGPVAEHAVRTPEQFARHAADVRRLYGLRLEQCRSIFLAGGDVLRRPHGEVLSHLATLRDVFDPAFSGRAAADPAPSGESGGPGRVHAFLDHPGAPRPSQQHWQAFAAAGLRRVSVGVESGDPEIRALYGRTWTDDDLRTVVSELAASGVGVGLLVLGGAGGAERGKRHVAATAALANSLDLRPGDLVSVLDAEEVRRGGPPAPFAPLTGALLEEQVAELKEALTPLRKTRGVKVAAYSLEKQGL